MTVIEDRIQKNLPTLILKLKQRASSGARNWWNLLYFQNPKLFELSDNELEQYVEANIESFKRELLKNVEDFQQLVLSAKPNPVIQEGHQEVYQLHAENYRALLEMATGIAQRMQDSFNEIFTQYRKHIENLWKAICDGQDVRSLQRQFDQAMQQNMNHYWKPVFDQVDGLIQDINKMTNRST